MRSCIRGHHVSLRLRHLRFAAAALASVLLLAASPPQSSGAAGYQYLSPSPGSLNVSPWNNVVVRHGDLLNKNTLSDGGLSVVGSLSGLHSGRLVLSDDSRTVVFLPAEPFSLGESVLVNWTRAPRTTEGGILPPLEFSFTVATWDPEQQPSLRMEETSEEGPTPSGSTAASSALLHSMVTSAQACDTLPSSYVPITLLSSDNPDPGCLFFSPLGADSGLLILDNSNIPIFFRTTRARPNDFGIQSNGWLTYFTGNAYYALDSSYAVVDSFRMGNGYKTNGHDMRLLPNGHALLMAYDPQRIDMSVIVPQGNANANVVGFIVQELDTEKNVVFQWRSWDHFQITDMVEVPGRYLTGSNVDYVHGNSIEPDTDGNILISCRHMDEITKIDRQTGEIIWRLGAHSKNNQFTIVNDERGFSHQHDARRLPNGNILMFDNGDYLSPEYSRALEYALDEQNKVATEVWEYRNTPDIYGNAQGSARRLASGGTLISWGKTDPDPKVTELHADGSKALELGFGPASTATYRAVRAVWRTTLFVPDTDALDFGWVGVGDTTTRPLSIHNNSTSDLELTCFVSSNPAFSVTAEVPVTVSAGGNLALNVQFTPSADSVFSGKLYLRSVHGPELIAQVVTVSGTGSSFVGVPSRPGSPGLRLRALPNPGSGVRTLAFDMPRPGPVELRIYDLRGRLVATPFAGPTTAGQHEVVWNGRSDASTPLHSGIYFARLTSTAGTRLLKIVNLSR